MDQKFYVAVKAVLFDGERLLLPKKRDQNGNYYWDIPGGKINEGENYLKSLHREATEEIKSLKINNLKVLLGAYFLDRILKDGTGLLRLFFSVDFELGEIVLDENEHEGYQWFTYEEFKQIYTAEDTSNVDQIKGPYLEKEVYEILLKVFEL